jgi:hypothetical protein
MGDDLVDVSLPIGPISVSVNGLLRKLFGRLKKGPADVVAERFLALFGAHGVAVQQIPRLLPQVTLAGLNSHDALVGALTNEVLDGAAALFGIQRDWLDGTTDELYQCRWCYKEPARVFEDLATLNPDTFREPLLALSCTPRLSATGGRGQWLVLLLAEAAAELGEGEVLRFCIYGDSWDWGYAPSRIQVKAMVRLAYLHAGRPVPLFRVSSEELEAVRDGKRVPSACVSGHGLNGVSLEDYGLSSLESVQAKEVEELPAVLRYIEENGLEAAAARAVEARRREGAGFPP